MKRKKIGYETQKSIAGFLFVLPWLLGFVFIVLRALISSAAYSVCKTTVTTHGMKLSFIGFENFINAFRTDLYFPRRLTGQISSMLYQVPVIIAFSLFMAVLLNREFRGRTVARSIFFIPVIVGSGGIILSYMNGDTSSEALISGTRSSMLFSTGSVTGYLRNIGLANDLIEIFDRIVSNVFNLTWQSGLQIVLFLAGLQSVSPQLYEAADVEGASAWEKFWKITFPMVMPIVMVNLIYTIIDSFTDYSNSVMSYILGLGKQLQFSYSSALSLLYFAIISVIVAVVYVVINSRITYTVR